MEGTASLSVPEALASNCDATANNDFPQIIRTNPLPLLHSHLSVLVWVAARLTMTALAT